MPQATLVSGSPVMGDFIAGANLAAGDVVVRGDLVGITHCDVLNGKLGALALGGAIYDVVFAGIYAAGVKLYWDDTANKVTTTASGNKVFGFAHEASTAADQIRQALHAPS